ncbi:MAG: hypothetical protein JWP11_3356 [Frankiales bacterium]|nr:hypothetical protein [Frankiales bacterium]
MSEQDDGLFDLDGRADPVAGPPDGAPRGGRRRLIAIALGAAAVVAAVAVAISTATAAPARPVAAGTTSPATALATSSAPASTTSAAPVKEPPAPETPPTVYADPAALADLHAVAATLTTRLTLTSPATWDKWLPAGKPYPGKDTADDLSTCPRLAGRLGAALGTKMSYWVGTLPEGPYGCQWATVPLYSGPNAANYPYLASVGFLGDGTTSEGLAGGFYHHQGRLCPDVAVPSVGKGAYLVRCEDLDGLSYVLVLRDTRTSGVWVLSGMARSDAAHAATDVLRPVIAGAAATFG